jgi:hypothetical protein
MSSINAENTPEADVSRLTDDQARAIVNVGHVKESPREARSRREEERYKQERQERLLESKALTEWRKSEELIKARKFNATLAVAFIVVLIGTVCGTFTLIVFAGVSWHIWSPVLFAGLIIDTTLGTLYYNSRMGLGYRYRSFRDNYIAAHAEEQLQQYKPAEELKVSVPEKWLSDPDLQNLLLVNRTQLNVYQDIATKDAKAASRNSRFAMIIGFLILVVGAVVTIRTPDSTSKIVVGALASLGSVLSGYIGQTFLRAQAQAMRQLNFYFRQPLVASYLLSAERIAIKLDDPTSTKKALLDVIKNVLLAADRAENLDPGSSSTPRRGSRRASNVAAATVEEAQPGT